MSENEECNEKPQKLTIAISIIRDLLQYIHLTGESDYKTVAVRKAKEFLEELGNETLD